MFVLREDSHELIIQTIYIMDFLYKIYVVIHIC